MVTVRGVVPISNLEHQKSTPDLVPSLSRLRAILFALFYAPEARSGHFLISAWVDIRGE